MRCRAVKQQRSARVSRERPPTPYVVMLLALVVALALGAMDASAELLGGEQVRLAGLGLRVTALSVPVKTAFSVPTVIESADGTSVSDLSLFATDVSQLRIHADLTGTGLDTPLVLDPILPSGAFAVPPLTRAGSYTVENLRLVDGAGTVLLRGEPAVITVVDRVVVTSVAARALSLEEILEGGIVVDANSFTVYQFTFGVATESPTVRVPFDMVIPRGGLEDGSAPGLPPLVPGLNVPNLDAQGFIFETEGFVPDAIVIPPIPGVIMIPGNIGFLDDFFQVLVVVSNVAPPLSQLVITSAAATMELPLGDDGAWFSDSSSDPPFSARVAGAPARPA